MRSQDHGLAIQLTLVIMMVALLGLLAWRARADEPLAQTSTISADSDNPADFSPRELRMWHALIVFRLKFKVMLAENTELKEKLNSATSELAQMKSAPLLCPAPPPPTECGFPFSVFGLGAGAGALAAGALGTGLAFAFCHP